jgi:hypothetical protein
MNCIITLKDVRFSEIMFVFAILLGRYILGCPVVGLAENVVEPVSIYVYVSSIELYFNLYTPD